MADELIPHADGVTTFTKAALDAAIASAVTRETGGLRGKNTELLGKLDAHKPLLEAIGDLGADDITAALTLAKETRDKKLRAEGDFDALRETHAGDITTLKTAHVEALKAGTDRIALLEGFAYSKLAALEATKVLDELGGSVEVMLPHITPFLSVVEDKEAARIGDRFRAVVLDRPGGQPRLIDGTTPYSIKALVEEFRDKDAFAQNFTVGDETGSGAHSHTAGRQRAHTITKEEGSNTQTYRMKKAAAEKAGVDLVVEG